MSIEITVTCDGCARITAAAPTAKVARRELKEDGGLTLGRLDYCPECVTQGKHGDARGRSWEGK